MPNRVSGLWFCIGHFGSCYPGGPVMATASLREDLMPEGSSSLHSPNPFKPSPVGEGVGEADG